MGLSDAGVFVVAQGGVTHTVGQPVDPQRFNLPETPFDDMRGNWRPNTSKYYPSPVHPSPDDHGPSGGPLPQHQFSQRTPRVGPGQARGPLPPPVPDQLRPQFQQQPLQQWNQPPIQQRQRRNSAGAFFVSSTPPAPSINPAAQPSNAGQYGQMQVARHPDYRQPLLTGSGSPLPPESGSRFPVSRVGSPLQAVRAMASRSPLMAAKPVQTEIAEPKDHKGQLRAFIEEPAGWNDQNRRPGLFREKPVKMEKGRIDLVRLCYRPTKLDVRPRDCHDGEITCAICIDHIERETAIVTPCNHWFHLECAQASEKAALMEHGLFACPTCRQPVSYLRSSGETFPDPSQLMGHQALQPPAGPETVTQPGQTNGSTVMKSQSSQPEGITLSAGFAYGDEPEPPRQMAGASIGGYEQTEQDSKAVMTFVDGTVLRTRLEYAEEEDEDLFVIVPETPREHDRRGNAGLQMNGQLTARSDNTAHSTGGSKMPIDQYRDLTGFSTNQSQHLHSEGANQSRRPSASHQQQVGQQAQFQQQPEYSSQSQMQAQQQQQLHTLSPQRQQSSFWFHSETEEEFNTLKETPEARQLTERLKLLPDLTKQILTYMLALSTWMLAVRFEGGRAIGNNAQQLEIAPAIVAIELDPANIESEMLRVIGEIGARLQAEQQARENRGILIFIGGALIVGGGLGCALIFLL